MAWMTPTNRHSPHRGAAPVDDGDGLLPVRRAATPWAIGVVLTLTSLVGIGCALPQPSPGPSIDTVPPSQSATPTSSPEPASPSHTESAAPSTPPPPSADAVTRVCQAEPFESPSELACTDAIARALESSGLTASVERVDVLWQKPCGGDPCVSPRPDTAYVVIRFADGEPVMVTVRLSPAGDLDAESPVPVDSAALPPPPPFTEPPVALSDPGPSPSEIAQRTPFPLCGSETAGLAGPFDANARGCFLAGVLNRRPVEFLSKRSDVEGVPLVELWRFEGRGPVLVFTAQRDAWVRLNCALLVVHDPSQAFDHTDCEQSSV